MAGPDTPKILVRRECFCPLQPWAARGNPAWEAGAPELRPEAPPPCPASAIAPLSAQPLAFGADEARRQEGGGPVLLPRPWVSGERPGEGGGQVRVSLAESGSGGQWSSPREPPRPRARGRWVHQTLTRGHRGEGRGSATLPQADVCLHAVGMLHVIALSLDRVSSPLEHTVSCCSTSRIRGRSCNCGTDPGNRDTGDAGQAALRSQGAYSTGTQGVQV